MQVEPAQVAAASPNGIPSRQVDDDEVRST